MRVTIDLDKCEGHGMCVGIAPTVFGTGPDDMSVVLNERPDENVQPDVRTAVSACPRMAISVVED